MSFDSHIIAFAERFLSDRTFQLIVAPAVADLQFEESARGLRRAANRVAVMRAVAGGVCDDFARVSRDMVALMLLPASYYVFLLVICFDVFSLSIASDFLIAASLIFVLSFGPVIACFWPERPTVRSLE
jgi:hypothetical protein